jgi:hypothetical protein
MKKAIFVTLFMTLTYSYSFSQDQKGFPGHMSMQKIGNEDCYDPQIPSGEWINGKYESPAPVSDFAMTPDRRHPNGIPRGHYRVISQQICFSDISRDIYEIRDDSGITYRLDKKEYDTFKKEIRDSKPFQFSNSDLSSNKYKTAARSKENTLALANAEAMAYCEKYGRKARPVEGEIKLEPYRTQPLFGLDFAPLDRAWYGFQKKYRLAFTMSCFDPLKNEQTPTTRQAAPSTAVSDPSASSGSAGSESAEPNQEVSAGSFQ